MDIEKEKERLRSLRRAALKGLPAEVTSAIELLKNEGFISQDFDPKLHHLRWRRYSQTVVHIEMIPYEADE